MSLMYPVIRRVRRPLVQVAATEPAPKTEAQKVNGQGAVAPVAQDLATGTAKKAATGCDEDFAI